MARQPQQIEPTELQKLGLHIDELIVEKKRLHVELLAFEARKTAPEAPPPGVTISDRTQHYLNGFAAAGPLGLNAGQEMHAILVNIKAITGALSELEQKRQRLLAIEEKAAADAATPRFLALIKADLLWAEAGKARHAAIAEMMAGPGGQMLPYAHLAGRPILQTRWDTDPASRVRDVLLREGVVTAAELTEASSVK